MPSCASPLRASAAATCGPTAASTRCGVHAGSATSSSASSRTSVPRCPRSPRVTSSSRRSSTRTAPARTAVPAWQTSCVNGGGYGHPDGDGLLVDAGQGEYVRVPYADGTLVSTPEVPDDDLVPSLLALSDVMGTGWHAATSAGCPGGRHRRGRGRRRCRPVRCPGCLAHGRRARRRDVAARATAGRRPPDSAPPTSSRPAARTPSAPSRSSPTASARTPSWSASAPVRR